MSDVEYVWFKHPSQCWSRGRVASNEGPSVNVVDGSGGAFTVPRAETHPYDASHSLNLDDIAHMNNMHEGAVCGSAACSLFACRHSCCLRCLCCPTSPPGPLLDLLRRRYMTDNIYTFTGDILISINPYKHIPELYTIPDIGGRVPPEGAAPSSPRPGGGGSPAPELQVCVRRGL